MTNQEAIRILNEQRNKFMDDWIDYGGVNEAYNMAISLLKKQEPKNPGIDTIGQYVCPNEGCHHRLSLVLKQNYCDVCGQAVKWDE